MELHAVLQCHWYKRGDIDAVPHREVGLGLEGADEEKEEGALTDEFVEFGETALDAVVGVVVVL